MGPRYAAGSLKRAEWVKFLATFFNKEGVANAYFAGVETAYNAVKVSRFEHAMNPHPNSPAWGGAELT